jgi:hypothetical protein
VIPQVAASERGGAQTGRGNLLGVVGHRWGAARGVTNRGASRRAVETAARDGESPVGECALDSLTGEPEYHGARATLWEAGGTTLQG